MKKTHRTTIAVIACAIGMQGVRAQSVSYSHDDTKMNQVTVQETGTGSLTPEMYYWMLHNSYRKTAAQKNKLTYRSAAGMEAYQQTDEAEKLDSAMVKRAEVEALNIADRTGGALDLAWGVEGDKVSTKLATYESNIGRILEAGGNATDQRYWKEQASVFRAAIRVTQEAYMPNSERKKQYLAIYGDIARKNESLVQYIARLKKSRKASELLRASHDKPDNTARAAAEAMGRWRSVAWSTVGGGSE